LTLTVHRYLPASLIPDYLRALGGLAIVGSVLLFVPLAPVMMAIFGGLAALFILFGVRTAQRQATRIEVTDDGIAAGGWGRIGMEWRELDRVKLRYYSTRRNRAKGWMDLSLGAGSRRLVLDSGLDGFNAIAARAHRAALARGLELSPATEDNFRFLELGSGAEGRSGSPAA
jgi:hypothetical protein